MNFIIPALILGLGSSLHCAGMCGPLMLFMFQKTESAANRNVSFIKYGLGKTIAYITLGIVVGSIGQSVSIVVSQQRISLVLGALILLVTVLSIFIAQKNIIFKPYNWVKQKIIKAASAKQANYLVFGFLNGLLPCGVVYVALAAAVALGNFFEAIAFMGIFGLVTLITLFTLFRLSAIVLVRQYLSKKIVLVVSMILVSSLLILRGANLGIKYISPKVNDSAAVTCCTKPA